jgi:hypothetical protein
MSTFGVQVSNYSRYAINVYLRWAFGSVQDEKPLHCNGFRFGIIPEMVEFCA